MPTESTSENNNLNNQANQWASHYLGSHGYTVLSNQPDIIQNTPWSYVVRFVTGDGYVYLKQTPKQLALEADIIHILRNYTNAVPEVTAQNTELNCFLMKDAGKSLRVILKNKFDETLLCRAIEQFTSVQFAVVDCVDVLLNLGVPDWRLDKLPALYKQLLAKKEMLIEDGLSVNDIIKLEALLPTLSSLCKKLSGYSIKQTMVQPDFNDNNSLIDERTQKITIIDVGEIAISHPLFSLINFLYVIKKHHALREEDACFMKIKDTCYKQYMNIEPNVSNAFEIAGILYFVYAALANFRLMTACDKAEFTLNFQRHGKPGLPLKELLTIMASN